MLKAADTLDYHPEWVFSGMGAQDIEITARILNTANPEQMKHMFGLGNLPLYVAGIEDPQRVWFNWYWGGNQGIYSAGTFGTLHQLNGAVSFAGPEAHAQDVPAGDVQHAAAGRRREQAAAELHDGLGPTPGMPYDVYSQVGLDYAIMWWNPAAGQGQDHLRRGHRPVRATSTAPSATPTA